MEPFPTGRLHPKQIRECIEHHLVTSEPQEQTQQKDGNPEQDLILFRRLSLSSVLTEHLTYRIFGVEFGSIGGCDNEGGGGGGDVEDFFECVRDGRGAGCGFRGGGDGGGRFGVGSGRSLLETVGHDEVREGLFLVGKRLGRVLFRSCG